MKCHEPANAKPIVVKAGNAAVKIYRGKSRGYSLFTVVHYAGGRRKRETFGRLADAKDRAREVARAIINGRMAVLELTNADREGYVKALELLRPLEIPLHSAVEEYVAARSHLNGESLLSVVKAHAGRRHEVVDRRVREVADELLAAKRRDGLSDRYLETLRSHLNRFAAGFETNIGSVAAKFIEEWLVARKIGPRARNNLRMSIITLFNFARSRGYLPKGLPTEAEEVPKAKDRGGKIGILSPKQLADLLSAPDEADNELDQNQQSKPTSQEAKLYLAIGAFTGLRSAELIRLEWEDVNFARGHIQVGKAKAKTATRRLIAIQPNLLQWISPYRGSIGLIFPSEHAAHRAIAQAKNIVGPWPSNALRHSYATYRLARCHDAALVALEMGNSAQMLFRNYRELADEQDAAAWFGIEPVIAANVVPIKRGRTAVGR
jgi:integrase